MSISNIEIVVVISTNLLWTPIALDHYAFKTETEETIAQIRLIQRIYSSFCEMKNIAASIANRDDNITTTMINKQQMKRNIKTVTWI